MVLAIQTKTFKKYLLIHLKTIIISPLSSNITYEKVIFSKIKTSEKSGIVLQFYDLLLSNFIESSWACASASTSILLQYVVLVEMCEEDLGSHKNLIRRGNSILIAYSGNCENFSLTLHQGSSGSLLKASCDVGSNTLLMNV